MALSLLSAANSFNPGADLWIISDFSESKMASKLDWYMNFQISRSQRNQKPEVPKVLLDILEKTKLSSLSFDEKTQNGVLYPTENVLPNRWVILLPETQPLEKWCERISQKWEGLRRPTLRIFLPQNVSAQNFEKAWFKIQKFDDLSIVLD